MATLLETLLRQIPQRQQDFGSPGVLKRMLEGEGPGQTPDAGIFDTSKFQFVPGTVDEGVPNRQTFQSLEGTSNSFGIDPRRIPASNVFTDALSQFNQKDTQFRGRGPTLSQPDTSMGPLVGKRQEPSLMDLLSVIPPGKAFGFAKRLAETTRRAFGKKVIEGGIKGKRSALTSSEKIDTLRRLDTGIRESGAEDTLDRLLTLRGSADAVRRSGMSDAEKLDIAIDKQEAERAIPVDLPPSKVFDFPEGDLETAEDLGGIGGPAELVNLDAARGAKEMQEILDALREGGQLIEDDDDEEF